MIHVERSEPPGSLTRPDGPGIEETKRAIRFYADEANRGEKYDFHAYREADVKERLIHLFRGKCAYCETTVTAGQDGDVEHFRPKGSVEIGGRRVKPGYYWLAALWENLFLACMHCNQRRRHRLAGGGELRRGKSDRFPVADESRRVTHRHLPANLIDERDGLDVERLRRLCDAEPYLLLDPCRDDPHRHLRFLGRGEEDGEDEGIVRAAFGDDDEADPRGVASIEVFGLDRPGLVQDRSKLLRFIRADVERIYETLAELDRDPDNAYALRVLEGQLEDLERYCQPDRRYSGMARQVVDRLIAEITGEDVPD